MGVGDIAGFVSSVAYGYIVNSYGYDAPFLPMIGLLTLSALLWFRIAPTQEVIAEARPVIGTVAVGIA